MGSPATEKDRQSTGADETQHEVEISRPFWMGIFEVTQEEYEKVMKANPSIIRDSKDLPVENVTWREAEEFCKQLSDLSDERAANRTYRLPTEAEWEYACRAGAKKYTVFHYGNVLSSAQANFDGKFPYGTTAQGPALNRTVAVGSYQPNAFGLYDMHGNVGEWCADWYGPYNPQMRKDPAGPALGTERVVRGGAAGSDGLFCRSAFRLSYPPEDRNKSVGFRVVVTGQ
jgi:formylglycine-generating enzyme required for sulfatase activity